MSTGEPNVPYGTTGERLKAFALNDDARDRIGVLATRYWEASAYVLLLISAIVLRFTNLGPRAYHHDESLHGFFAWGFTEGLKDFFTFGTANDQTYKHVPFMHGPFQFIGSGFFMWIFGDGDYQGRILAAVLGTAMVGMPFLLRKQLGTFGAIAASAFICFSPTLMYYSRFTREDIYTAFWTLGIVIFIWRYLETREDKFLYLSAGFMAGAFCTKETTFMTVGAFLIFLDYMLAVHIADHIRLKSPMNTLQYAGVVALLMPVAWLAAIAWPFISNWRAQYDLDELPAAGPLLIVLGTLAVPQYSALVQFGLGEEWQNRAGDVGDKHILNSEETVAYTTIFFLIGLSSAIGLLWRPRTWLFASAAFWVPFILLYTTFFSNPEGFFSGMWGSADYWISQQEVARGNQPQYYYFITIPVYEFLPLALSAMAGLYYGIRGERVRAMVVGAALLTIILSLALPNPGPEILKAHVFRVWIPFGIVLLGVFTLPMHMFNRFLIFWVVITAFALTVASEKMPWLNVHIALGLAVLAGKFVGDILGKSDLRADLPKLERLAPFAYAAFASALAIVVFVVVGPFAWQSFGAWALVAVAAVAVYWAFSGYSARTGIQVALVGFVAAFMVFSLRAGYLASFGHPNNPYVSGPEPLATRDYGEVPIEILVYTQTSGDIPGLRDRIAQYGRDTGKGLLTPVVVDSSDGYTWPWAWYLRDYKDVTYANVTDNYQPPKPGSILLIAKSNSSKVNLGGQYDPGIQYHHRRWFPEEYRGIGDGVYTTHDFFGDVVSPSRLGDWLDFWVRRTLPAADLGTVDGVAYFPKGTGVVSDVPAGPTVRTEGNQLVIGGQGSAKGQLTTPSDVALDATGNIYIADTDNNRVQKYDPNGVFIAEIGGFSSSDVSMNQPWSVAVADDGSVFVADTWNHKILKFDTDLKKVKEWGSGGQTEPDGDPTKLFGPREIVVTANGNVMISDTGNSRIIEYTSEGDFVRQFGGKAGSGAAIELNEPVGIETNAAGDIYIADFWNKRVLVLGSDLAQKRTIDIGTWGSQAVTDRPYMALLDDGRLLVTDPANGKVLAFGADGAPLGEYALPKEERAPFARPVGIASDGESVLVVDSGGNVTRKIGLNEMLP